MNSMSFRMYQIFKVLQVKRWDCIMQFLSSLPFLDCLLECCLQFTPDSVVIMRCWVSTTIRKEGRDQYYRPILVPSKRIRTHKFTPAMINFFAIPISAFFLCTNLLYMSATPSYMNFLFDVFR